VIPGVVFIEKDPSLESYCYWPLVAKSHLTRRLFGGMLRIAWPRGAKLSPVGTGWGHRGPKPG
jgi:hypothetical protein